MGTPESIGSECANVNIHSDALSISGQSFLTSIGEPLHCGDVAPMKNKKSNVFCKAIDEIIRKHNNNGCQVAKSDAMTHFRN